MTRVDVYTAVRALKVGDAIVINTWDQPMKVCGVADAIKRLENERHGE